MGESRSEYVKCALRGDCERPFFAPKSTLTWCGRPAAPGEFTFTDASHAALNGDRGGRLVLCRSCRDAIVMALDNGFDR